MSRHEEQREPGWYWVQGFNSCYCRPLWLDEDGCLRASPDDGPVCPDVYPLDNIAGRLPLPVEAPPGRDITLKDVQRVAKAVYREDDPAVVQLDLQTSGRLCLRQGGVTYVPLGEGPSAEAAIRRALAFLDDPHRKTIIDALKGELEYGVDNG